MSTIFQHRLILIVPVAKVAAVVNWITTHIGADAVPPGLGPALNASSLSSDPATHAWLAAAYQDDECRMILSKLCQLAAVTPPTLAQWQGWTRAEKIAWLQSVRTAIRSGHGSWVILSPNDGAWDDAGAQLATMGLQVQASANVPA